MKTGELEIICIDDEPMILDYYNEILANKKFSTKMFSSSIEAKRYIDKNFDQIGAIICDYKMPDLDGLSLINDVSSRFGSVPLYVVSGYLNPDLIEQTNGKVAGCFEKPIDPGKLESSVLDLIAKTKSSLVEKIDIGIGFSEEALPRVEELEELFLKMENESSREESVQAVYRILHTLKGTAASVGLTYLAMFCHSFETRLSPIREKREEVESGLISNFLSAQKHLMNFFLELKSGKLNEIIPFEELMCCQENSVENVSGGGISSDKDQKINVSVEVLNGFVEGLANLTIMRNLILNKVESSEYIVPNEKGYLVKFLNEVQKVQNDMKLRAEGLLKIPFNKLNSSLNRNIRDLSQKLKKNVQFKIIGGETLFDYNSLQALSESLVHLIRNCMDHGIENEEIRVKNGKPKDGSIVIEITESPEKVTLSIKDDGGGILPEKIIKKALEKKLLTTEQVARMSESEIFSILFLPGFSTAENISEVSGRGVGLDSVKKSVEVIEGNISIKSQINVGTEFLISIPQNKSVSIVRVMVVLSEEIKRFAVPASELIVVEKVEKLLASNSISKFDNKLFFQVENKLIEVLELSEMDKENVLILTKKENDQCAVLVNQIEISEDVVLRELDPFARTCSVLDRAAISGTHGAMVLLDTKAIKNLIKDAA